MSRSLKVLFIAFACEPERGSEPGVGWNCVYHASRKRPVWVITDSLHRNKTEAYLARKDEQNIHMVYHALPRWCQWMWKSPLTLNLYYYLWMIGAAKIARKLHRIHRFDVAHHVSYVRYWMPTAAAEVGIPFVWGPVGGGEAAPVGLLRGASIKSRFAEWTRAAMRWIFERDPRLKSCASQASVAFACSQETARRMQRLGVRDLRMMSCIGTNPSLEPIPPMSTDGVMRFISVGRLLHWKGFHFGLRAFAQADIPNSQYVVVGGGEELPRLRKLAYDLGIENSVIFTDELPWREGLVRLLLADVLIHPSLHDSGGFVLLEAMELSKPVICLDLGGPALHVNEETGIRIPAKSPEQVINDLTAAMRKLANDPELRARLGEAGSRRAAEDFSWQNKAREFEKIYQHVAKARRSAVRSNELAI